MEIYLDGTEGRYGRVKVVVDVREYWLTPTEFKVLLRLCVAHPGWVPKQAFGDIGIASKYIHRLTKSVPVNVENGQSKFGGHYRINASAIGVNTEAFVDYYDYEVREMVNGVGLPHRGGELVGEG